MRLGEEDDRSCDLALVRREEGAQRERRRDEVVRAKKEMEKVSFLFAFSFFFTIIIIIIVQNLNFSPPQN